jgi:hypothetical protein
MSDQNRFDRPPSEHAEEIKNQCGGSIDSAKAHFRDQLDVSPEYRRALVSDLHGKQPAAAVLIELVRRGESNRLVGSDTNISTEMAQWLSALVEADRAELHEAVEAA